jgi:3-deoxy-manno-octulosonate cytidylyltransferase (CMP-KDO synthetase)
MTPIILIPARLGSTRLPNKPLADIAGLPMIVHVLRRALAADLGPVAVACGESAIADAVRAAGGTAILTDPGLPSGSDRIFAALQILDPQRRHDIIINLQGDLPTIEPAMLRAVLTPLADPAIDIATLVAPITSAAEAAAPSVVKAACAFGEQNIAPVLYFSRNPIPAGDGPRRLGDLRHPPRVAFGKTRKTRTAPRPRSRHAHRRRPHPPRPVRRRYRRRPRPRPKGKQECSF